MLMKTLFWLAVSHGAVRHTKSDWSNPGRWTPKRGCVEEVVSAEKRQKKPPAEKQLLKTNPLRPENILSMDFSYLIYQTV